MPRWLAPLALAVNTAVVVVLQFRVSALAGTVARALCCLGWSAAAFGLMAVVFAFGGGRGLAFGVCAVFAIGQLLTAGELLESPSWWTISFALAPTDRTDEYLAAFDLCFAVLNIAGPLALIAVVRHGVAGWLGYLVVLAAAAAYAWLAVSGRHAADDEAQRD